MSSPRSAVIYARRVTIANTWTQLFTCPAQMTIILKTIGVYNQGSIVDDSWLRLYRLSTDTSMNVWHQAIQPGVTVQTSTWLVIEPGDTIWVFTSEAQESLWISGTVLQGVAVIPPAAQQLPSLPTWPNPTNS